MPIKPELEETVNVECRTKDYDVNSKIPGRKLSSCIGSGFGS